ncbi:MAG: cytochrome c biogenesis protein CcsA [Planctomycetes bacterium]|nr:cytochrome c biogenesis protein CcsA [Planctomycetota bacterium]
MNNSTASPTPTNGADLADGSVPGALPLTGGSPGRLFLPHALITVAALAFMNWLIIEHAPFGVKQIGASYLIAFYHVPSAILMGVAYTLVFAAGIMVLLTKSVEWDRRARAAAAAGLLANGIVLVTGSVWGKAAWNLWWNFQDPRLTTSAVIFLIYLAYFVLSRGIEDEAKRARICAIYGILALLAYMPVKYAVEWFGQGSHPPKVAMDGAQIRDTLNAGLLAFFFLYSLLYRWKYDLDTLRERSDAALARVRRLEDSRS